MMGVCPTCGVPLFIPEYAELITCYSCHDTFNPEYAMPAKATVVQSDTDHIDDLLVDIVEDHKSKEVVVGSMALLTAVLVMCAAAYYIIDNWALIVDLFEWSWQL